MIRENFVKLYEESFKNNWDLKALSDYSEKTTLYYKDLAKEIARIHILLGEASIQKGDKIALIGKNNAPWCTLYLAVISYGAVIVPILQDFSSDSVHHIINHSESKLLFTNEQIWENLDKEQIPEIKAVFSTNNFKLTCLYEKKDSLLSQVINELDNKMRQKYPEGYSAKDINYAEVDNSEVVLINYTSGTTGFSKGVMLTGNNLAGNVTHAHYLKLLFKGENIVSFLPLAHAYGAAFEFLYSLTEGAHTVLLGKTPAPNILAQAFLEVKPTLIISVPLVIEKIYKKAILPKIEKPTVKALLKVPVIKNLIHKKVRNSLITAFGGNCREVIIGGAALNAEVEAFLHKIKFPFTVGYGMTECAPLISYDHNYNFIPTSCGKILDNIMEVRIDSPDPYSIVGEIQVRGENVMKGYYKNEKATKAAFTEDGWLKTGDLGTIDINNRIFIRGRSKSMILGPSGQNIFPEEIESKLSNMPFVLECVVVQRENKLTALVYPDHEAMDAANIKTENLSEIMNENKSNLNKTLANYENISAIEIVSSEFEKTPKKSIKRYLYENQ